jgi:hypothetical protein
LTKRITTSWQILKYKIEEIMILPPFRPEKRPGLLSGRCGDGSVKD